MLYLSMLLIFKLLANSAASDWIYSYEVDWDERRIVNERSAVERGYLIVDEPRDAQERK